MAFVASIFCCLKILSPRRKWDFAAGAAKLVQHYRDSRRADGSDWTLPAVQRDLALHMERAMDQAIKNMKAMQAWYLAAGIALGAEIACWLIGFAN